MTTTTTRRTTTDAPPRAGSVAVALPGDPGLDVILADPHLTSTAKALITVLVKNWAWRKDHCWPSDRTLAAKVAKSVGHVQRCLRELEQAGRIARERTAEVLNGRRIWLLWRCPGGRAGARPDQAPVCSARAAPARSEPVVVVNEERERNIPPASRPRPEADPIPSAAPDAVSSPALQTGESPLTTQVPREVASDLVVVGVNPAPEGQSSAGARAGIPDSPTSRHAPGAPPTLATLWNLGSLGKPTDSCAALPRLLRGAMSAPPAASRLSASAPGRVPQRRPLGLSLDELARVVETTGDPILARELARRTAPAPPEPPADSLPTPALLARLPGRHDLIAAVTQRLCAETGDFKPASWSFFQKAAEAVASRMVGWEVLQDCHRQAVGPQAKDRGRVFVVAWKRQAPLRC